MVLRCAKYGDKGGGDTGGRDDGSESSALPVVHMHKARHGRTVVAAKSSAVAEYPPVRPCQGWAVTDIQ